MICRLSLRKIRHLEAGKIAGLYNISGLQFVLMHRHPQVKYKNRGMEMKTKSCAKFAVSAELMAKISDCLQLMHLGRIPVVTFLLPTTAVFC
jgi:hypothetical protein